MSARDQKQPISELLVPKIGGSPLVAVWSRGEVPTTNTIAISDFSFHLFNFYPISVKIIWNAYVNNMRSATLVCHPSKYSRINWLTIIAKRNYFIRALIGSMWSDYLNWMFRLGIGNGTGFLTSILLRVKLFSSIQPNLFVVYSQRILFITTPKTRCRWEMCRWLWRDLAIKVNT